MCACVYTTLMSVFVCMFECIILTLAFFFFFFSATLGFVLAVSLSVFLLVALIHKSRVTHKSTNARGKLILFI